MNEIFEINTKLLIINLLLDLIHIISRNNRIGNTIVVYVLNNKKDKNVVV
jgi:hypothetical protein